MLLTKEMSKSTPEVGEIRFKMPQKLHTHESVRFVILTQLHNSRLEVLMLLKGLYSVGRFCNSLVATANIFLQ